jgi:hypothetical protein
MGPKVSGLSVLCRSYGAWLTSATGAGYKHGAPPELAPGALTSDLPALAALEFKGKDVGNDKCFSWVWKRRQMKNRFNGLPHSVETVETVPSCSDPLLTQLKHLSLPTTFSHEYRPSFYSCKTLGKPGAPCSALVRTTRGRGAAANPPRAAPGTACSVYFITYSCIATYIISVTQPSLQKMWVMTRAKAGC